MNISNWALQEIEKVELIVRSYHLELYDAIKESNPVDTTQSQKSWIVSLNQPLFFEYPIIEAGNTGDSDTYTPQLKKYNAKIDTAIYFANGADHTYKLEYEYASRQAPNGMVRIHTAEANKKFDEVARRYA